MSGRSQMPISERFMEKVSPEPNSGCWLWDGTYYKAGYGSFSIEGRATGAHRAAWRIFNGNIPPGMEVCHRCDVKECVNLAHLFLGTHKQNQEDAAAKGRMRNPAQASKTHCVKGHLFAGDNLVVDGRRRRCRECMRASYRKYYLENRTKENQRAALRRRTSHV